MEERDSILEKRWDLTPSGAGLVSKFQDQAVFSASCPHEKEVTALVRLLRNGAVWES